MTYLLGWTLCDAVVAPPFVSRCEGEVRSILSPDAPPDGRERLRRLTRLSNMLDVFLPALPNGGLGSMSTRISADHLVRIQGLGQLSVALRERGSRYSCPPEGGRSYLRHRFDARVRDRVAREAAEEMIVQLFASLPVVRRCVMPAQHGADIHLLVRKSDEEVLRSALSASKISRENPWRSAMLTVTGIWPILHFADSDESLDA